MVSKNMCNYTTPGARTGAELLTDRAQKVTFPVLTALNLMVASCTICYQLRYSKSVLRATNTLLSTNSLTVLLVSAWFLVDAYTPLYCDTVCFMNRFIIIFLGCLSRSINFIVLWLRQRRIRGGVVDMQGLFSRATSVLSAAIMIAEIVVQLSNATNFSSKGPRRCVLTLAQSLTLSVVNVVLDIILYLVLILLTIIPLRHHVKNNPNSLVRFVIRRIIAVTVVYLITDITLALAMILSYFYDWATVDVVPPLFAANLSFNHLCIVSSFSDFRARLFPFTDKHPEHISPIVAEREVEHQRAISLNMNNTNLSPSCTAASKTNTKASHHSLQQGIALQQF